eukprot:CAMPEP_0172548804 /NCGR_PEP_ID=MMETSP1067-20121228/18017_1 /TAXON_ID=265564 ORGANISM="Thalassiosira punctigera, Strain Tpunct2005C2" /NCGR_SAMPLE_ID=MMETSP1067 /ASSEMBLY_ACC=CAM_ASM_000444 /LENGTH=214 /DNA_ID=CAMNT_0013336075 /DNA_START=31 /DNA_END=672 /DNA_ORIENTATION=+
MTSREERTQDATGSSTGAIFQSASPEERAEAAEAFASPSAATNAQDDDRVRAEIDALSDDEKALLTELRAMFDPPSDPDEETADARKEQAERAKEIIEAIRMDVDFPALPYGETFLSGAICHSLDMVKMLLEKGADVNKENEMMNQTALDQLLEEEDCEGSLSNDKKEMKRLLLSKGATTAEQRWNEVASSIRREGEKNNKSDNDDEDSDKSNE